MVENLMIKVVNEALMLVLILSGPPILVSMVVGLVISVFQATTQIQEQTLSSVPKLFTVFITLSVAGYWMMSLMVRFAQNLFYNFPNFVH
jgi:flagellar biosynthetic protein FliQ